MNRPNLMGTAPVWLRRAIVNDRGVLASSMTAIMVRGAGVFINLLAIPIALHILGSERFASFLVLLGLINWVSLGAFGIQPAFGKAIASGNKSPEQVAELLGAALIYTFFGTVALAVILAGGFALWLVGGREHVRPSAEILQAAALMTALTVAQVVLQVFEGIQMGKLRSYLTNLCRIVGSIFTFAVLLVLPRFWHSMSAFVVAINGGLVLGGVVNAWLASRTHPAKLTDFARNSRQLVGLALSGMAFVVISLVSLGQTQALVIILAAAQGVTKSLEFGLYIRLLMIHFSVVAILTAPLWPALMNARQTGGDAWARHAIRRTAMLVLGGGLASGLAVALFGEHILSIWSHKTFTGGGTLQVLVGLYFFLLTWSHFWAILLISEHKEWFVAKVCLIEALAFSILGVFLAGRYGAQGLMLSILGCQCLMTFWIFPYAYIRWQKESRSRLPT